LSGAARALHSVDSDAQSTASETAAQAEIRRAAPKINLSYLAKALIKYNASDLHIRVGRPPLYRINGRLFPAQMAELNSRQIDGMLLEVLNERHTKKLEQERQVDLSFKAGGGRFRCNIFYQRGQLSAAIRMIPSVIPHLEGLGLPRVLGELCTRPRGLILVTGITGSGKSTTLASMVQLINETQPVHILTIEDPIEFVHRDLRGVVTQREVGSDTPTLQDALRGGLRQDPDVIMIGEMRDPETIMTALTAAETGHLVMSTLHTTDARGTIERILDVFPPNHRTHVRAQLASNLVGVCAQQLVDRADGNGRVPACEILIKSPAIQSIIAEGALDKIQDAMQSSGDYYKMQTMNQALEKLVRAGTVTEEEALKCSSTPDDLRLRFSGFVREEGYLPNR